MNVGDLVLYADGDPKGHIGIVVKTHRNSAITVFWGNGVESNHPLFWLIPLEEIK